MPAWSIMPSDGEFAETYGFLTDIILGYNAAEQRVALRRTPLETIEFSILADGQEAQLAQSLIYGAHSEAIDVPLWQYGQKLNSNMNSGTFIIPVTTADIPFLRTGAATAFTGVMVWQGPFAFQWFTIAAVNPTNVTTGEAASQLWAASKTLAFPTRRARLPSAPDGRWASGLPVIEGRLTFTVEG